MNTIMANSDMLSNIDPWDPTMLSDSDSFHFLPVTWTHPTAKCQRSLHNHPAETGFHTAHIWVFAAEASLVTVGWQTLLFLGNSCGIVACVLSRRLQRWHHSPNTVWHVTRQALLVCVCERESLCRSRWSTLLRAGFPDLVKKQQGFNGLSSAGLKTCWWLCLATPTLAVRKNLLLLFLDVFFADPPSLLLAFFCFWRCTFLPDNRF